jgi:CheY-like chemotaxis protein
MASLRVLLVEDEENWQTILRDKIVRAFQEIDRATDSEVRVIADFKEAWRALEKDGPWDLLVTDMNLDPSDIGTKLGKQLASLADQLQVPTIVVSGTMVLTSKDARDLLKNDKVVDLFGKNTFDRYGFIDKVKSIVTRPSRSPVTTEDKTGHEQTDLLQGMKGRLIDELSKLSISETPNGRTSLLDGIPGSNTLSRDMNIARLDLEQIITQLAKRGRMANGELSLVKLIDNAIPYAKEFEGEDKLEAIKRTLMQG